MTYFWEKQTTMLFTEMWQHSVMLHTLMDVMGILDQAHTQQAKLACDPLFENHWYVIKTSN